MSKLPGQDRKDLTPEKKQICDLILFNEINSNEIHILGVKFHLEELPYEIMKEYFKEKRLAKNGNC